MLEKAAGLFEGPSPQKIEEGDFEQGLRQRGESYTRLSLPLRVACCYRLIESAIMGFLDSQDEPKL